MTDERFSRLDAEDMTPEQVRMVEAIAAGPRGRDLRGPFKALLRSPDLGLRLQHVGSYIRFESVIPPALNEMAILLAGRRWTSQFEFYAHRKLALDAGLPASIADAIAVGRRPETMSDEQAIIWTFCNELLETTAVSDVAFHATVERFGERGVVDLICAVGYYGLISMILNVDRVQLPPGEALPLPARP